MLGLMFCSVLVDSNVQMELLQIKDIYHQIPMGPCQGDIQHFSAYSQMVLYFSICTDFTVQINESETNETVEDGKFLYIDFSLSSGNASDGNPAEKV